MTKCERVSVTISFIALLLSVISLLNTAIFIGQVEKQKEISLSEWRYEEVNEGMNNELVEK
ncbi:TPA: hypothetical protein ONV50_001779 [Enterococcus faecium]|uniref:hypothetical protein n=1 Tax=Enterococcus TaxID=1350 RepID=UPI0006670119|nr:MULTISPECIES: hypothetical protein [Enterococcus]AQT58100.1 hypothetical protein BVA20_02698 [Enterococcus faecium]AQY29483.1 hypothetical protein B4W80_11390 [Enterococcus faecium]AQY31732.1 hypothetical protein B4W81_06935 [Enterococcus faecium]MBQ1101724.1 hypothetical protein [Enterococcus faecium]MBQ1127638.1 hypothetical protein [Enterococcus faecium]